MKSLKKVSFMFILTAFILLSSSPLMAEERNIYVGDLIELKITTREFTEDEMREKFKDFEIVELKSIPEGYLITLRTFEAGEKVVNLADSEIIITVKSTLDEIDRDELFEGSFAVESAALMINLNYLFYAVVIVFFASGGVMLANYIRKRRDMLLTPYERFNNRLSKLSSDDGDYLVKLTMYFKEYIELKFSLRIKGKTSKEMIGEMSKVTELNQFISKIGNWLNESDYFKFSGYAAAKDKKQELLTNMKEIVSQIEQVNEGKA